jgi:hypothetical protein
VRLLAKTALATALVAWASSAVTAQAQEVRTEGVDFVLGAAVGAGAFARQPVLLGTAYGQTGFRLELAGGLGLGPRFDVLFRLNTQMDNEQNGMSVGQACGVVVGRLFLSPLLWVEGGIGVADLSIADMSAGYGAPPRPSYHLGGLAVPAAVGVIILGDPEAFAVSAVVHAEVDQYPRAAVTGEPTPTNAVPVGLTLEGDWY